MSQATEKVSSKTTGSLFYREPEGIYSTPREQSTVRPAEDWTTKIVFIKCDVVGDFDVN